MVCAGPLEWWETCNDIGHIMSDGSTCVGDLCWVSDFFITLGRWLTGGMWEIMVIFESIDDIIADITHLGKKGIFLIGVALVFGALALIANQFV